MTPRRQDFDLQLQVTLNQFKIAAAQLISYNWNSRAQADAEM